MSTKKLLPILRKEVGPLTFGKFLRVARNSLGLSQAQMAKKLVVARGTLCDIEKGRQLVSIALAVKVAKKAGLSIELAVQACLQDQVNGVHLSKRVKLGAALIPVVDLDIVWIGGTFPGFDKRLQAHQKDAPLGAAMMHELHRLLPTLVFEEDDGVVAFPIHSWGPSTTCQALAWRDEALKTN